MEWGNAELRSTRGRISRIVELCQGNRPTLKDIIRIIFPLWGRVMVRIKSKESCGAFSSDLSSLAVSVETQGILTREYLEIVSKAQDGEKWIRIIRTIQTKKLMSKEKQCWKEGIQNAALGKQKQE